MLKNFVAIHKQHELTKIARFSLYEFSHAPQGTQPNSFHARAASFAEQHANSFNMFMRSGSLMCWKIEKPIV
ncbi:MAG: hypothetical protein D0433_07090 [Candidatus Thermochlorobacter aerophilum]|uniref:Uncharacterized protein n=1 Tax=Candidatus Thermochlorobacter aerophilus TaxID=1868324 RepID=A0A395M0D8_9BACT|nr:MAG: hypothetical protein D0433_07090 [Candidatus Thermochlorobacter aerophilum]